MLSSSPSPTPIPVARLSPFQQLSHYEHRVPLDIPLRNSPARVSHLTAGLKLHSPYGATVGARRSVVLSRPMANNGKASTGSPLASAPEPPPATQSTPFPLTTSMYAGNLDALLSNAPGAVTSVVQTSCSTTSSQPPTAAAPAAAAAASASTTSKGAMDIPIGTRSGYVDGGRALRSTPESLSSTVFLSRSPEPNKHLPARHIHSTLRVAIPAPPPALLDQADQRGRRPLSPTATAPPLVLSTTPNSSSSSSPLPSPASDYPQPPHSSGAVSKRPPQQPSCMRRSKSLPSTPRVRFNAMLEQVRHFDASLPVSTSASNSEDEYYYDESDPKPRLAGGYRSSESDEDDEDGDDGRAGAKGYKCTVSVEGLKPAAQGDVRPVAVESVFVSFNQHSLEVTTRVANLAYSKEVVVRYTTDEWRSTTDTLCDWMDGFGSTDRFRGRIPIPTLASKLRRPVHVIFAVRYRVGTAEYWDNNGGANYHATVSWKTDDRAPLLSVLDSSNKKRRKKKRKRLVVRTAPATTQHSSDEEEEEEEGDDDDTNRPCNVRARDVFGNGSDGERDVSTFLNAPIRSQPLDEPIPLPRKPATRPHAKYDITAALAYDAQSKYRREMPKFSSPPASLLGYYLSRAALVTTGADAAATTKDDDESAEEKQEACFAPIQLRQPVEGFDEPFGALTLGSSWDDGSAKRSLLG